jgi:Leucine-rich repeat (LRR) protein
VQLEPLSALTTLRALNLLGCKLREVPASLAALPHLERLSLANNFLEKLPDGAYLARLTSLDISTNKCARSTEGLG